VASFFDLPSTAGDTYGRSARGYAEGQFRGERFATAGGAGLRLLINKRSKTNLCLDFGFGKQGSKGIYLAVQEAF
jgi:hypothetical protein